MFLFLNYEPYSPFETLSTFFFVIVNPLIFLLLVSSLNSNTLWGMTVDISGHCEQQMAVNIHLFSQMPIFTPQNLIFAPFSFDNCPFSFAISAHFNSLKFPHSSQVSALFQVGKKCPLPYLISAASPLEITSFQI